MADDKTDKDEPQTDDASSEETDSEPIDDAGEPQDDESTDSSAEIAADDTPEEVEEREEDAPEEEEPEEDDSPPSDHTPEQPTSVFKKIDNAIYKIETIVVVTALIAMSVFVFTDVAYQLAVTMSQQLSAASSVAMIQLSAILGFIGMMAFAATGKEEEESPAIGVRIGVAVGVIIGTFVLGYSLLHLESATIYRVTLVVLAIPVFFVLKSDTPKMIVFAVAALFALWIFGRLPAGFSWAQSYSLVLLLWVGFLGASIAARERRHLRVDLMRKLCPPKYLAHFNAVSYLVAATFTGVVLYLGYIYMFGNDSSYLRPIWDAPTWLPTGLREQLLNEFPVPEDASLLRRVMQVLFAPSEPGELPDWLKAAAIPVSMLLIAARFLGHSIGFARLAFRGETFEEDLAGSH